MNIESVREHLAIEVMGWHVAPSEPYPFDTYFYADEEGALIFGIGEWKPDENIEQAMGCLDTFPYSEIVRDGKNGFVARVVLNATGQYNFSVKNKIRTMAISLVRAKATGWKES